MIGRRWRVQLGGERDLGAPVTLAANARHPVAAVVGEALDAGLEGFADPQPVEQQQADQRRGARGVGAGGSERGADLAAGRAASVNGEPATTRWRVA